MTEIPWGIQEANRTVTKKLYNTYELLIKRQNSVAMTVKQPLREVTKT